MPARWRRMRPFLFACGLLMLGACSEKADESAAPAVEEPVQERSNAEAVNSAEAPAPAGGGGYQWFSRNEGGDGWAGYGPPFSETEFSARCERKSGQIVFNTAEVPPTGAGPTVMHVSAEGLAETIPAVTREDGLPHSSAEVDAGAEWLARLARVSGDLKIRVGDSDGLTVPISQPLRSLIRDCAR